MFLSLKINLILAYSVDSDEMQRNAAFHLGLHCLPKYLLLGVFSIGRLSPFSNGAERGRYKHASTGDEIHS